MSSQSSQTPSKPSKLTQKLARGFSEGCLLCRVLQPAVIQHRHVLPFFSEQKTLLQPPHLVIAA